MLKSLSKSKICIKVQIYLNMAFSWNSLFAIHIHTKIQYNVVDEDDLVKDNFEQCWNNES